MRRRSRPSGYWPTNSASSRMVISWPFARTTAKPSLSSSCRIRSWSLRTASVIQAWDSSVWKSCARRLNSKAFISCILRNVTLRPELCLLGCLRWSWGFPGNKPSLAIELYHNPLTWEYSTGVSPALGSRQFHARCPPYTFVHLSLSVRIWLGLSDEETTGVVSRPSRAIGYLP